VDEDAGTAPTSMSLTLWSYAEEFMRTITQPFFITVVLTALSVIFNIYQVSGSLLCCMP
jgi:hypothetical protein